MGSWKVATLALLLATGTVGCGTTSTGSNPARASRASGTFPVRTASAQASREEFAGGLGMRAEQGSIDQEDAEEAINRHFTRLSRCYEAAGDARDFAGGGVTLRFVIGIDGRTREVSVIESRLGSIDVERCLRHTALGIRFPRPHGHAAATFEYSLEFRSTGEVPLVELPADAAAAALPALLVRLATSCQQLGVDQLDATLYIDRTGTVRSVGLAAAKPLPEPSAACIAQTIRQTVIPVVLQGRAVGRTRIALRNHDVLHPPVVAVKTNKAARTRQGRRPGKNRR